MVNIYCDESNHLEHDNAFAMLMGAMSCPASEKVRIYNNIRSIKKKHGLSSWAEIKWTGVSNSKLEYYLDLIDYFIKEDSLSFRVVIIRNKQNLNHKKYNFGSHDLWYYKTYYYLLDAIVDYSGKYKIFIDIKDTKGGPKVKKLRDVLCNKMYDFNQDVILGINQIKSNESEILQLTDLIMGCIGYYHNNHYNADGSNVAKNAVLSRLLDEYGSAIRNGTSRGAKKMDVFLWDLMR